MKNTEQRQLKIADARKGFALIRKPTDSELRDYIDFQLTYEYVPKNPEDFQKYEQHIIQQLSHIPIIVHLPHGKPGQKQMFVWQPYGAYVVFHWLNGKLKICLQDFYFFELAYGEDMDWADSNTILPAHR